MTYGSTKNSPGFIVNDGGRREAGFTNKATAGDCVARAISIASGRPYREVYDALAAGNASQRITKGSARHKATAGRKTASHGIYTRRKWFKDYMRSLGFEWVPTMAIGSGCTVHLDASELPAGRLVVMLSKHATAMIDGVIHDAYDPRWSSSQSEPDHGQDRPGAIRSNGYLHWESKRCVYGYWKG